jgi:hypothetical protein
MVAFTSAMVLEDWAIASGPPSTAHNANIVNEEDGFIGHPSLQELTISPV